jgi:hypothetical protein
VRDGGQPPLHPIIGMRAQQSGSLRVAIAWSSVHLSAALVMMSLPP